MRYCSFIYITTAKKHTKKQTNKTTKKHEKKNKKRNHHRLRLHSHRKNQYRLRRHRHHSHRHHHQHRHNHYHRCRDTIIATTCSFSSSHHHSIDKISFITVLHVILSVGRRPVFQTLYILLTDHDMPDGVTSTDRQNIARLRTLFFSFSKL